MRHFDDKVNGGDEEIRTLNFLDANQALSQLSYTPIRAGDRNRTYNPLITNQKLYQLSYTGIR